jgi:steroid delta-isomerase-like uncharacterized protein
MAGDLKQTSRKVVEQVFGKGDVDALDELCDASFKAHDPLVGEYGLAALKGEVEMYRRAFPDLKGTVREMCAEGDTVCTLWQMKGTHQGALFGVEPTGKQITVDGITFDRYRNGKIIESFVEWDTLHFLHELGVAPRFELGGVASEAEPEQPHA